MSHRPAQAARPAGPAGPAHPGGPERIQTGWPGRAVDRLVQTFAPRTALRRTQARAALGDGYEISRSSRTRRRQAFRGGPADVHQDERTLFQLREMCRAGDRQSCLLHGIIDRSVDNVLGPTFEWQPCTDDPGWNKDARAYIEGRAGLSADIRRKMDLRALACAWYRAQLTDGDILIVHSDDGLVTYEADQLVTPRQGEASAGAGKKIVNGVEVDPRTGRDLAYHVARREYKGYVGGGAWSRGTTRVPAAEALLVARFQRTSQTRGVPALAPGLMRHEHLEAYLDSEQIAAEIASHVVYMITRSDPAFFVNPDTGELHDWVYNAPAETGDATSRQFEESAPGQIIQGVLGDKLDVLQPNRPGQTFEPYLRSTIRLIGAAVGMPLELVLLDLSQTNYSSARAALLQAYRTFRCWQHFLVRAALGPIYQRWIGQAIVDGDLGLRDDAFAVKWLMPTWAWIDPLKEVLAKERAVAAGFDCITDTIEEERETLEGFVVKRRRELDLFRLNGIPTSTAPENLVAAVLAGDGKEGAL